MSMKKFANHILAVASENNLSVSNLNCYPKCMMNHFMFGTMDQ